MRWFPVVAAMVLSIGGAAPIATAQAQDPQAVDILNRANQASSSLTSYRFDADISVALQMGGVAQPMAMGGRMSGAVELPDRMQVSINLMGTETETVTIGDAVYVQMGGSDWERSSLTELGGSPLNPTELSEQIPPSYFLDLRLLPEDGSGQHRIRGTVDLQRYMADYGRMPMGSSTDPAITEMMEFLEWSTVLEMGVDKASYVVRSVKMEMSARGAELGLSMEITLNLELTDHNQPIGITPPI